MKIIIKEFNELSNTELYQLLQLREITFILEQHCIYNDLDDLDFEATHLLGYDQDSLIGYVRILKPHQRFDTHTFSRVISRQTSRRYGIGSVIVTKAINYVLDQGYSTIKISAQVKVMEFYKKLGFIESGEVYLEDDIEHVFMKYVSIPQDTP